jgi:hypothetical protein
LGGKVIDFGWPGLLDDANEIGRVGHIAVVQHEAWIFLVRVLIEMIDTVGIERRGAALDAVDRVAFAEQELGKVTAVLASGAGYERYFV